MRLSWRSEANAVPKNPPVTVENKLRRVNEVVSEDVLLLDGPCMAGPLVYVDEFVRIQHCVSHGPQRAPTRCESPRR